ncbi:MAG TPA: tol-pal system protein YbgF [Thermoanaerobaculia bacterium]|jgi:tol-pal system protein YbgF|nr:tol-pal system protein YbgF [Thermoanaerobaculia bacterium]
MKHPRLHWSSVLPSLLLLAGGLLAGCASSGESRDDQIRELQNRVLELQRKTAVADVELARLRQQVAELMAKQGGGGGTSPSSMPSGVGGAAGAAGTGAGGPSWRRPAAAEGAGGGSAARTPARVAGSAPPPSRPAGAAQGTAIDEMDIDVPPARSSQSFPPPQPSPRTPPARAPVASSAPPLSPPVPSTAPPAAAQVPTSPVLEGKREPVTPAVQALYDRGYTLYHQKHYVDAESSFQRFLQAEPKSELADNAQYWIGECRYSRGDMRGALAAFRETVARYPAGNKTADALLKAGMSLENLGDKEAARNTYQEVLKRYPGTAVAAVAEERRAKLP